MNEVKQELIQNENILIAELYDHGAHKVERQKDKYSCVHCSSSDALSIYKNSKGNYCYKCFSCNETGNVIDLIMKLDNKSFTQAIEYLCTKNNIVFTKPKTNTGIDKGKVINFYENQFKEAVNSGDQVQALRTLTMLEDQKNSNYFIQFPYVNDKGDPLKVWQNVEVVLKKVNLIPVYNVITKELEVLGAETNSFNDQILDLHSACHQYGLKVTIDFLIKAVNRIGSQNKYNPVTEYLEQCEFKYDGNPVHIKKLCDTLIVPEYFSQELRNILVTKWLLNTVNIVYNEGYSNTEGCLVLQGSQGCGKTTWIKKLVPKQFLKTGLDLDPSSTDSIRKCIKYWVVELGELDSTMKSDQAKLKAFLTEAVDEYRIPYAVSPERFNRTTSFYGTVNKANFLKDETGDRRYWVIPVDSIDYELLNSIDMDQVWGEAVTLLAENINNLNLNKEELKLLNKSNEAFRVKGTTQIAIETSFAWDSPKETWVFMQSSEIARKLGLKSTGGLKEAAISVGAIETRKSVNGKYVRGFIVPPFIRVD